MSLHTVHPPVEIRETPAPTAPPTPAEITARLRAHLGSLPRGSCMFCGSEKDWRPLAWGQTVIYSGPDADAVPTATRPTIVLECGACGLTVAMNAHTAGVLPG